MAQKPTPERYCVECGAKLERKRQGTRLEGLAHFIKRQFCDHACRGEHFTIKPPQTPFFTEEGPRMGATTRWFYRASGTRPEQIERIAA